MHNAGTGLLIVILVPLLIGGVVNFNYYESQVYPIDQIAEQLHNAQSTTNLSDKAATMSSVLSQLEKYEGNPNWLFPMDYTNFDSIKKALSSMIMVSIELDSRADVDAMSYQQSLSVIDDTIQTIHNRIHSTAGKVQFNVYDNPLNWMNIVIFMFIASPMVVVADYLDAKRKGRYW